MTNVITKTTESPGDFPGLKAGFSGAVMFVSDYYCPVTICTD